MTDISMAHIGNYMMPKAVFDEACQYRRDNYYHFGKSIVEIAQILYPDKVTIVNDQITSTQSSLLPATPLDKFIVIGPTSYEPRWTVVETKTDLPQGWFTDPQLAVLFAKALNDA